MIQDGITILDGGFSTELENSGYCLISDPLWSARFLHTNPSAVVDVHRSYLDSGCDIITTASYQASFEGFMKHLSCTREESGALIKLSVHLAVQARQEFIKNNNSSRNILIAGSVGPYGAYLADGSEYTGEYCDTMSEEELTDWHRQRVQCLVDAGVDILAFETIPAAKEGLALVKLLHEFPETKAWLSFSSQSKDKTVHGEDIGATVRNCLKMAPAGQLAAVGINCCPPSNVLDLLNHIKKAVGDYPLIAYPNSGEKWISNVGWTNEREGSMVDLLDSWSKVSTKLIIGGCCRTSSKDITQLVEKNKLVSKK